MGEHISRQRARFQELLRRLAREDGVLDTPLAGVRLMRASGPRARGSVIYEPSIVIVGQGRKIGYLGGEVYHYDAYNYLVLSVPLPFECETQATAQEPLLALSVGVDAVVLGELLLALNEAGPAQAPPARPAVPRGICSNPLTEDLLDAALRLLECLGSATDCRILGPQLVREIVYRVLQGQQGGTLRALAAQNGNFSQIARSLKRIHTDYAASLDVETLAREVGMSVSAFHHNFKAVTSASPLRYLKTLRLHKARLLMLQGGVNASVAAGQVGYVSASQFSREFKRLFGNSPLEEVQQLRGFYQGGQAAAS